MPLKILIFCSILSIILTLPHDEQLALASSLIVGRDSYDDLFAWNCKVCDNSNKPIHAHVIEEKQKDVKCIITLYPDQLILAFRYTNTAQNVWQDILYPLQINPGNACSSCKVQKAHNSMWVNIRDEVIADLKEMKAATKMDNLHITGISLGGGLSILSYKDILDANIFKNIRVTTYGAPRVGNKDWAAWFDKLTGAKTKRYVVNGDPVAVMPKCLTLLCNYGNTGVKINCYEEQQLCKQEVDTDDLQDITNVVSEGIRNIRKGNFKGIVDHIDGYPKIYNFTLEINK